MSKKFSILLAMLALLVAVLACGIDGPAGVSNIRMGNHADATNLTTTFAPNDVIYVFFDVNQVDTGASFQYKWHAINIDGLDPATPLAVTDYAYDGASTLYAQLESTEGGFAAGQYKVEIYLDGVKVGEQGFTVQ